MKRFFVLICGALLAGASVAATTVPIQLLNPTGSTAGQAIVSTGASSAPTWGAVNASTLNGATFASPPASGYGSTTPEPVAATTISASGLITPSTTAGIAGTTAGDSPNAGSVGQYVTASSSSGVTLTNGSYADVVSISLTAGDWDVGGDVVLNSSGTTTAVIGGIGTTSNTNPTGNRITQLSGPSFTSLIWAQPVPEQQINITTTTTVYLGAQCNFSSGSATAQGKIWARRRR